MPNERPELLAELVKSAIEQGRDKWPAFLDRECASDSALRAEAESLLAQHAGVSCFLETPAAHLVVESLLSESTYSAGYLLGDYEVLSLIGKGGMGEVYLAQDRKLGRKVALKLIQHGLNSAGVVRHFKREENLLASLNHPNIAQLYDGGASEDGSPFFAMEYVEGQRLDAYCNARGLSTKERLQIFRKICSAVSYAHQHLVIHRDLKPANIRVTPEGEPKLLDFGIAKLLDGETAAIGQTITIAVMTPDYASPEQVHGESMTTASDIYSLGVVLYELLTGARPHRLTSRTQHEISRVITDQNVARPSMIANQKALRGDLDNIVLMALRKEPARRYSSVGQFSEDIRRHLDGLPVIARKDTLRYRSAKFIARHKVGVAAAALVALTLIGGSIVTLVEARRAERQRARAETRFNDVRKLAHSLLYEILPKFVDSPGTSEARKITVQRALEYLDSLSKESNNDATLMRELAGAYRALGEAIEATTGDYAQMVDLYQKALALDRALVELSPKDAYGRDELAREYERIGWSLWFTRKTGEAFKLYQKALDVRVPLMAEHPEVFDFRYRLAHLRMSMADLFNASDDTKEALRNYGAALALLEPLSREGPINLRLQRAIIYCYNGKGEAFSRNNELSDALSEYDRAFTLLQTIYTPTTVDPTIIELLDAIEIGQAMIFSKQGEYERALALLTKRVQMWEEPVRRGDANSKRSAANAYSDLGAVLCDAGDLAAAKSNLQKALQTQEELLPSGVSNIDFTARLALSYERLGLVQTRQQAYEAALDSYGKAMPLREENASDTESAGAQNELALCCKELASLHVAMAKINPNLPEQGHWRVACSAYRRSRDLLRGLHELYPDRSALVRNLEEVAAELETCEAALMP